MNQEEFVNSISKQQSFIRRLFKRRSEISQEIEKISKEYFGDIIGKFFYVSPDDRNKFRHLGDGYYFIYGMRIVSNYASDDKVEIHLLLREYGVTTHGFDDIVGVDIMENRLCFSPSEDMKSVIKPLIVSKEEGLKELKTYFDTMITNLTALKNYSENDED